MKDNKIVEIVVKKVMKDFEFDIDYILDADRVEVEESIRDSVLENIDSPPGVEWIELVELDEAEAHKNKNGDFLSN